MAQFRDNWYPLAPPWLGTGNAERYVYTMMLASDLLMEKMNQAVRIRLPGQGDPSQIPYLANDRQLVQGPLESTASFIQRLIQAFQTWKKAGSRLSILGQLQSYLQGMQPGVPANYPMMAIVGGNAVGLLSTEITTWDTIYQGDAIGAAPTHMTVIPGNWPWGSYNLIENPWRTWLVLYMTRLATGLAGTGATTGTATGTGYGTGQNVAGVWVPNVTTPINTPFLTVNGLSGLTSAQVGQWLTMSGSAHSGNIGVFPIVQVLSASSCVIANPKGVTGDSTGTGTWSIEFYPFIAPAVVWGAPGYTFGQGELQLPARDTGSRIGGVWEPGTTPPPSVPSSSWGLSCAATTIQSIRNIVRKWKGASAWYHDILVTFVGGNGTQPNSAFVPTGHPGTTNPTIFFDGRGELANGIWVPNRQIGVANAPAGFDAWCQGTIDWPGGGAPVT